MATDNSAIISSHIQMPKSVLRRFEKNARFYYYDVEKRIIGSNGHAKSLYTESGYYSQETEDFLRDNIETPFGQLLKFIDSVDFDKPSFSINSDFDATTKRFAYALISRSPTLLPALEKKSIFFQLLPEQQQHDIAVVAGITVAQMQDLFTNYTTTIAINRTSIPFVLPVCGLYTISIFSHDHIVLPTSPRVAIVLVPEEAKKHIIKGDLIFLYSLEENTAIYSFNRGACKTQLQQGYGFIVSPEKGVLEHGIQEIVDRHKELKK